MDFQVRKGLETPLKVHGMRTKFFCIYCIILAVIVLFVVGFLTSAMSGEGSFFGLYRFAGGRGVRLCGLADRLYQPFHAAQVRQVQKTGICHIE
ncbi:hypothetical protein [Bacteroides faecis]|uniref:hypothetical protein n=1 Tax=Bacteroides faecis TaxID=674529 RepID=UPI0039C85A35